MLFRSVPEESNETVSLPDVLLDPDHAPDAEHEVELDEDHVIVTDSPTEIALSDADRVTPINGLGLPPPPPPPPHATISDRDKNKNNVFLKRTYSYYQINKICLLLRFKRVFDFQID